MTDQFESHTPGLTSPAAHAEAVIPSDIQELANATRILFVGTGGDITAKLVSGETVTLRSTQSGAMYPLRLIQVMSTGTTATDLVGLR